MKLTEKMTNTIKNQKGIALVATLMILVLGFAVVAIMFRLSTQETKLARLEQGYTTALDAAKAGTDLFIYMVQNGVYTPPSASFGTASNQNCLAIKMNNSANIPANNWSSSSFQGQTWSSYGCPSQANATNTNPTVNPDITLTLSNYTVNVKVIDNYQSGATGNPNPNGCQNGCFYYTVVTQATSPDLKEHSDIFFVYRYDK